MFIAALFTMAKGGKPSRCPSVGRQVNERWSIYTVEYISTFKRKEILTHAATWMNLEDMLSEKNQYKILYEST